MQIALHLAAGYPLRPDRDRMRVVLIELISAPSHFAWICTEHDVVRGVLLAMVSDNLWAQRRHANILLWWSERAGKGVSLVRTFKRWLKDRRGIRVAGFSPDEDLGERTLQLMELLGFNRRGGSYLLFN